MHAGVVNPELVGTLKELSIIAVIAQCQVEGCGARAVARLTP